MRNQSPQGEIDFTPGCLRVFDIPCTELQSTIDYARAMGAEVCMLENRKNGIYRLSLTKEIRWPREFDSPNRSRSVTGETEILGHVDGSQL